MAQGAGRTSASLPSSSPSPLSSHLLLALAPIPPPLIVSANRLNPAHNPSPAEMRALFEGRHRRQRSTPRPPPGVGAGAFGFDHRRHQAVVVRAADRTRAPRSDCTGSGGGGASAASEGTDAAAGGAAIGAGGAASGAAGGGAIGAMAAGAGSAGTASGAAGCGPAGWPKHWGPGGGPSGCGPGGGPSGWGSGSNPSGATGCGAAGTASGAAGCGPGGIPSGATYCGPGGTPCRDPGSGNPARRRKRSRAAKQKQSAEERRWFPAVPVARAAGGQWLGLCGGCRRYRREDGVGTGRGQGRALRRRLSSLRRRVFDIERRARGERQRRPENRHSGGRDGHLPRVRNQPGSVASRFVPAWCLSSR